MEEARMSGASLAEATTADFRALGMKWGDAEHLHKLKETWLKGSCAMMGDVQAEDGSFVPLSASDDGEGPDSARSTQLHELRYDSIGESFELRDAEPNLAMQHMEPIDRRDVVDSFGLPQMGPPLSTAGLRVSPRASQRLLQGDVPTSAAS